MITARFILRIRGSSLLLAALLCVIGLASASTQAQPATEDQFLEGNLAYANGDFAKAEAVFRTVLESGQSAEVHFNLGNALARQNKWTEAAFHFLEAEGLDPHFEPARGNLLLAARTLGLETPYPRLPAPANLMGLPAWTYFAAGAFWVTLFLLLHRRLVFFELPLARTLTTLSLLLLLFSLFALYQHTRFMQWAVVAQPEAILKIAPTADSPGEAALAMGQPVRILDAEKGFARLLTPAGDEGFLPLEQLHSRNKD
jgi:tetratricopeptide (TPR) repeat protein